MKVNENIKLLTVSQTNLSKALGLTSGRVAQLISEGVVIRDDLDKSGSVFLFESVKNYYSAKKTSANGDDVDYWEEKAKHEKAKREMAELQLAKAQGKVYDARTVELVITEEYSRLRTQLLGLPSKLAPMLENKDRGEIHDILTREIEEKLNELSEYDDLKPLFAEETIEDEESE